MHIFLKLTGIALFFLLTSSCSIKKGDNPQDPYEQVNRSIYKFNAAFDATVLKPPAKLYKATIPAPVRSGINNMYNNVNMLPTMANDILQWEWNQTIKDFWRFALNSTFGIAGIFDVATSNFSLPPHSNDLGITFAKWGDKKSPYVMLPFLGPSTIRDGFGLMFDFGFFTPYPYITNDKVLYSIVLLRYVDLRSQMLDTDRLIEEAIDPYTFIRDAYLQRRNFLITGKRDENIGALYVDEDDADSLINETPEGGSPSDFPITTAKHDSRSTAPARNPA